MKTLTVEEAKDEVAKRHGYDSFYNMYIEKSEVGSEDYIDETILLYHNSQSEDLETKLNLAGIDNENLRIEIQFLKQELAELKSANTSQVETDEYNPPKEYKELWDEVFELRGVIKEKDEEIESLKKLNRTLSRACVERTNVLRESVNTSQEVPPHECPFCKKHKYLTPSTPDDGLCTCPDLTSQKEREEETDAVEMKRTKAYKKCPDCEFIVLNHNCKTCSGSGRIAL